MDLLYLFNLEIFHGGFKTLTYFGIFQTLVIDIYQLKKYYKI